MATQAEQIQNLTAALTAPVDDATKAERRRNRRTYTQGQSLPDRDKADGARDAERVIAGLDPIKGLEETVTPAYRQGWEATVQMLLEAFPGSEVVA